MHLCRMNVHVSSSNGSVLHQRLACDKLGEEPDEGAGGTYCRLCPA